MKNNKNQKQHKMKIKVSSKRKIIYHLINKRNDNKVEKSKILWNKE